MRRELPNLQGIEERPEAGDRRHDDGARQRVWRRREREHGAHERDSHEELQQGPDAEARSPGQRKGARRGAKASATCGGLRKASSPPGKLSGRMICCCMAAWAARSHRRARAAARMLRPRAVKDGEVGVDDALARGHGQRAQGEPRTPIANVALSAEEHGSEPLPRREAGARLQHGPFVVGEARASPRPRAASAAAPSPAGRRSGSP